MKRTKKVVGIFADWKDTGGVFEEIKKQLRKLGLQVYDAPSCEGTDEYGVIITQTKFKNAKEAEASLLGLSLEDYKREFLGEE